ncbi:hypothetical protein QYE76_049069 [Lolium multiflorum]|uniref:Reverse transcriptase zinc-binding domain-containing protein n=1 Tax=Lolium multiflorum TaxID=4521 RepID=A0AAD8WHY8_LOLMU|nr:hypothetical protein QYE76_049069 [Lolium multiflorum]
MSEPVWGSFSPMKCKVFAWLTLRYRLWTSDRRARHGLQEHPDTCYTCLQEEDNVDHIFTLCPYTRQSLPPAPPSLPHAAVACGAKVGGQIHARGRSQGRRPAYPPRCRGGASTELRVRGDKNLQEGAAAPRYWRRPGPRRGYGTSARGAGFYFASVPER